MKISELKVRQNESKTRIPKVCVEVLDISVYNLERDQLVLIGRHAAHEI